MSSFHFPIMSTFSTFLVYLLLLTIFLDVALALRNPPSGSSSLSSTPTKIGNGYRLISIEEMSNGGLLAYLQVKDMNNIYGPDIPALRLFVKHETGQRLRVHITDAVKPRWEIPCELLPRERPPPLKQSAKKSQKTHFSSRISENELIFNYTVDPFSFTVTRKSDNQTLFDTSSSESDPFSTLVFKDQYLEISTKLPYNASLYGLGENTQPHGIKLHVTEPYTLYTKDVSANNLNTDLYGSHPFYMDLRNVGGQGYVHGVLLLNSNGMDVFYRGNSLTYKVIGGVFDFYFFVGPSPLDVVDQYTSLIGRPAPMPYWAFGFHQCRWGYKNLSMVKNVVDNYKKAKIPLDVIWNDADHMDGHKDFTLNPVNFPRTELLAFLNKIHSQGMKYVVIIDPGIAVNSSYGVYKRAVENDVFIKYEGVPFLGQLWPGPVYFPDFLNPKTVSWWMDEIRRFHELVPVDGLWIDMNEISNLCSGMCSLPQGKLCPSSTEPAWTCCLECTNITKTTWDDPPYRINVSGTKAPIGYKTIATSAVHYNGVLEYDAHSLYGLSEAIATHQGLQAVQAKRPFVLSRSTFVGSGKYVAHWTGDNQATWDDLRYSISTMLNFGLFGVPMVGSDICGFMPQTTEELCNRWIELGAFYPFARDHANYNNPSQELYVWDTVAASARKALGMRYKLLPYLYTLNYEAHSTGAPIARPVFFSFENYTDCYNLSTQFLLGSGLMVSPVLQEGATTVTALFPAGSWYNLFDMAQVVVTKEGEYVTLDAPLNAINVHLYQNNIIPMQQGGMTSKEARVTPYELLVTFPFGGTEGQAKGNLFVDEGELPEMKIAEGSSTYVDFYATVKDNILKVWSVVQEGKFALDKGWTIEKVTVLGLSGTTSTVTIVVDGNEVAGASAVEAEILDQNYNVNSDVDSSTLQSMQVHNLLISGLSLPIGEEFRLFAPLRI